LFFEIKLKIFEFEKGVFIQISSVLFLQFFIFSLQIKAENEYLKFGQNTKNNVYENYGFYGNKKIRNKLKF